MNKLLSRISVAYQIGVVGTLGVLGLIVVGGLSFVGAGELAKSSAALEQARTRLELLNHIKIDLLEALRADKDFLLGRKEEFTAKHSQVIVAFKKDSKALADLVGESRRAAIEKVEAAIAEYDKQFGIVVADTVKVGVDENSGLMGTLRQSVHDIEKMLDGNGEAALDAAMLMMRRHEKDFFARHDRKYIDQMQKAAERFNELLAQSAMPAGQKAEITRKNAAYQRDFKVAAEATIDEIGATAKLSQTYADAQPLIDELDTFERKRAGEEKAAAEAIASRTTQMIGLGIAFIAVLVGTLAWLIGRGVARPLTGMAGLMHRLASGDLAVAVADGWRKDEVGTLARSLEVFKQNALKARDLAAERDAEQARKEQRRKAIESYIGEFDESVRESLEALASAATEMRATATSMSATAEETQRQAATVAAASEQTSANVQTAVLVERRISSEAARVTRAVDLRFGARSAGAGIAGT